jgi:hypothetical protein
MTQATTFHAKSTTLNPEMEPRSSEEFDIEEDDPLAPHGSHEASIVQRQRTQATSGGNQTIPQAQSVSRLPTTTMATTATPVTAQKVSTPSPAYPGATNDNGIFAINVTVLVVAFLCLFNLALTVPLVGPAGLSASYWLFYPSWARRQPYSTSYTVFGEIQRKLDFLPSSTARSGSRAQT